MKRFIKLLVSTTLTITESKKYSFENKVCFLAGILLFFSCEKDKHKPSTVEFYPGHSIIRAVKSTRQVFPNFGGSAKRISNCSYHYNSKAQLNSVISSDSVFTSTQIWVVSQYSVNYSYTDFNKISKIEFPGSTRYYIYGSDQILSLVLYPNPKGGFDTMHVKSLVKGYFTEFIGDFDIIKNYYSEQLDSTIHIRKDSSFCWRTQYHRNSKIDLNYVYNNIHEPLRAHHNELTGYTEILNSGSGSASYKSFYYRKYDALGFPVYIQFVSETSPDYELHIDYR